MFRLPISTASLVTGPLGPRCPRAADDEALARELDAELNASGRRTRARAPGGRNPYQQPRVADEEGDWDDDDEDEDDPVCPCCMMGDKVAVFATREAG